MAKNTVVEQNVEHYSNGQVKFEANYKNDK